MADEVDVVPVVTLCCRWAGVAAEVDVDEADEMEDMVAERSLM